VSTRQLASRARRRVDAATPDPDEDLSLRRQVADAFLAASRAGDFEGLIAILDPDVVARADGGKLGTSSLRRGARDVASGALFFARLADSGLPVLVNGEPGIVGIVHGQVASVLAFTIQNGRITALDILTDPERLDALNIAAVVRG
jgi:RNA polymerase sigma-70 factor (ECF subfamily)